MATTTLTPAASAYRSGLYEWVTTTDHKKIGILYLINSFIFFFIGGIFPLPVPTQLAAPGLQILHHPLLYKPPFALIGTSSILGGITFLVTIFKMRAPGMTLFRMPILVWTVLVTSVLVVMATPVLTSALIMLFIDRNYGGHFFDPSNGGGSAILW